MLNEDACNLKIIKLLINNMESKLRTLNNILEKRIGRKRISLITGFFNKFLKMVYFIFVIFTIVYSYYFYLYVIYILYSGILFQSSKRRIKALILICLNIGVGLQKTHCFNFTYFIYYWY